MTSGGRSRGKHETTAPVHAPAEPISSRDGLVLIREVRSWTDPVVPVLALTAYARPEDRDRVLAAGFRDHLSKPVDPRALLEAVARLAAGAATSTHSSVGAVPGLDAPRCRPVALQEPGPERGEVTLRHRLAHLPHESQVERQVV